jgi:WhiB family redox-sensing transcriptional regulator
MNAVVQDWRQFAACAGAVTADRDPFFAGTDEATEEALSYCMTCPVRVHCLAYAIETGQRYGVWGGHPQRRLRRLIAQDRQGATRALSRRWHGNARKTHCRRGHPFTAANTYYSPQGRRNCRICLRLAWQRAQGRRAGDAS